MGCHQTLLIASVALNALLVIALCSSALSSSNLGATAIRSRVSPVSSVRAGRMATFAQKPSMKQNMQNFQKTMGAAGLAAVGALHQLPAEALVDSRLNGDGAGIPLGLNDSRLFFILAGVFTTVWGVYATSVKGISDNDDEDSGMGLS